MRRLLLLRHAKASRAGSRDDHARPLAPRGIWAAEAVAAHCEERLRRVDVALCSSAIRTHETLRLFERYLPPSCKIELDDALYLADRRVLLAALRRLGDGRRTALLVGHEPGLAELAHTLCADAGSAAARRHLAHGLKTASLAAIELSIDHWSELRPGAGRLRAVIRPKDLR